MEGEEDGEARKPSMNLHSQMLHMIKEEENAEEERRPPEEMGQDVKKESSEEEVQQVLNEATEGGSHIN